ncbi:MAG: glycoside hydrolase family 13 protein [Eubacteriales bacterium]
MLPRLPFSPGRGDRETIRFEKWGTGERGRKDLSRLGAFPCGQVLTLRVTCLRRLGVSAVVLRLCRDGEAEADTPFAYISSDYVSGQDRYELTLDTAALCGADGAGLFYYRLLLVRDGDTLFTDSVNNVDFELVPHGGTPFRLLVYSTESPVPAWFGEGVMYHVFVDRFCRGAGPVSYPTRERGAVLDPDWDHGIPQYASQPGGELSNNVFFGGNLWGVTEKLDYLQSLGVKVIYLSPLFRAYSNHKYDTGDYLTVDPGFGGEAALDDLLEKAGARGIRVILDGVFNHTGDDSLYFNKYGTYPTKGAAQSQDSPYRDWYTFQSWPDKYDAWWGIPILPKLNHQDPACRAFFTGPDGVCARYIRRGVSGWRLDVADELSDDFLDELRVSVRAASESSSNRDQVSGESTAPGGGPAPGDSPAVIIGEVWENAADKVAYGKRRRYLQGKQLDSVMNYPIRSGILAFVQEGDAEQLYHVLTELYASYPRPVSDALMNLLGTHDTERILTVLGSRPEDYDRPNCELAVASLSDERRQRAVRLLKMAATLQFTVFGIPSVYYGDEVGMEGYHDPFCRRPFPWGELEAPVRQDILDYYRRLGQLRLDPVFHGGDFAFLDRGPAYLAYERRRDGRRVVIAANRGDDPVHLSLDRTDRLILTVGEATLTEGQLTLGPDSAAVIG